MFDDYVKKVLEMEMYSENLKPRNQTVSNELAEFMWDRFEEKCK